MQITVKLFATFRTGRFAVMPREYPPGVTVGTVLDDLEIPEAQVGMLLRNGRHVEPPQPLEEGDTLSIFPLVGGG
jgi:molybdopterin converting factor small subunit